MSRDCDHYRMIVDALRVALIVAAMLCGVARHGRADEGVNPFAGDPGAAREGSALYASAGCIPCHGPAAEGAIGPNLIDDKWMKRFSEGMVFRTIRNGRRGTRMIGFKGRLSEEQTWKIVEFLLAKGREMKAGGHP